MNQQPRITMFHIAEKRFNCTVPHEIVTIETFFSKFSLCAVGKLDIFSERNVFRKHKICEKFLNARLQKSVHIEA